MKSGLAFVGNEVRCLGQGGEEMQTRSRVDGRIWPESALRQVRPGVKMEERRRGGQDETGQGRARCTAGRMTMRVRCEGERRGLVEVDAVRQHEQVGRSLGWLRRPATDVA